MRVGIPTEVKDNEFRVAITPSGVHDLVSRGHDVVVQTGAGIGSAIRDQDYLDAGATLSPDADETWNGSDLILKVKEPVSSEFSFLHENLILFTYLHLAAERELTDALLTARTTAIAYETVQTSNCALPLLAPMSTIAGRLASIVGAHTMLAPNGGSGLLLPGVPGTKPGKVVILGGGVAGSNAARVAVGLGADVSVLDTNIVRLSELDELYAGRIKTTASNGLEVENAVRDADLVIGSVLIPGARAPKLVSNSLVAQMKPGSVLVDIAVDQGGCFADSHPTTHTDPTFMVHGSVFYCVANMPGAVPHTSTYALTNSTMPYVRALADHGIAKAVQADKSLALGVNTYAGAVMNEAVALAHGLPPAELAF